VIIVGNGSYQPIDTYASTTSSAYPIYTDPTCRLHKILKFKSALKEQNDGEEKKDYMQDAGTAMSRIVGGIKGALGSLHHVSYIGPKSLNGGEVIIAAGTHVDHGIFEALRSADNHADGSCEYMYRMQNTVDHTNVADLAKLIGIQPATTSQEDHDK
jgi:hypothetical protein